MLFGWGNFQNFPIWVSLIDGGTAPEPAPPPSATIGQPIGLLLALTYAS